MINSLSVCVPTYNRNTLLKRFYNSLKNQNYKIKITIEIVFVDDGSSDNTSNLIKEWINEKIFKIKYIYQKNSGRSSALRKAISNASMDYSIIMDDDCYFLNDFFHILYNLKKNINNIDDVAGFAFLRKDENGKIIGNLFKKNYLLTDLITIRSRYKKKGDIAEITKTQILKNNLYQNYENEKRMPTGVIWLKISEKYTYYFINEAIRVTPYLQDGISKNLRIHKLKSPNSTLYYYTLLLQNKNISIFEKFRVMVEFTRYFIIIPNKNRFNHLKTINKLNKLIILILSPLGFIFMLTDKYFANSTRQKIR